MFSMSRMVRVLVCGCFLAAGLTTPAGAAPGDVDRSFGQEGTVSVPSDSSAYVAPEDMTIGPGGEIYVLRSTFRCTATPCDVAQLVSRYLPNGLLDEGFGVKGVKSLFDSDIAYPYFRGGSLAASAGGQVVVAATENGKLTLVRLNHDGSPDGGFGTGGAAPVDLGTPVGRAQVAIQADGRIVIAAQPEFGYVGNAVLVTRVTAQGAPDPTFHGGTPLVTSLGSGFGGFALTASEQPVLAGPRCCATGRAVHLARLTGSGVFDSEFGRGGESFVDDVASDAGVGALIPLRKGGLYVVGSSKGKSGDAFVLRLTANGRLARKFGHAGIAYLRHSFLDVKGAAVDRRGRLLIAGIAPLGTKQGPGHGPRNASVLRLLASGGRDRTFAGGQLVRLRALGANQLIGAGLQSGRKLVLLAAGGECIRTCPSPRTTLIRFLGGDSGSRCAGRRATIVGTRHGEKLVGTPHRDVIAALAGDDLVKGRGGNDLICGGRGNDRLFGGVGRDVLRGGAGRNQLHG